jgi:hypothetical protein
MAKIGEYELIDHGIQHSGDFWRPVSRQNCEVAFLKFANAVTGIGDNPAAAIVDCLEQIAQAGFETEGMEARIMEQKGWEILSTFPTRCDDCDDTGSCCDCDCHCYVSIRWNERS